MKRLLLSSIGLILFLVLGISVQAASEGSPWIQEFKSASGWEFLGDTPGSHASKDFTNKAACVQYAACISVPAAGTVSLRSTRCVNSSNRSDVAYLGRSGSIIETACGDIPIATTESSPPADPIILPDDGSGNTNGSSGNQGGSTGGNANNGSTGGNQGANNSGGETFVSEGEFKNPINANTFGELVVAIADLVTQVAIPIVVIFIMYSGFLFVSARGNASQLTKAKETFYWTIVGALIVVGANFFARATVNFARSLGGSSDNEASAEQQAPINTQEEGGGESPLTPSNPPRSPAPSAQPPTQDPPPSASTDPSPTQPSTPPTPAPFDSAASAERIISGFLSGPNSNRIRAEEAAKIVVQDFAGKLKRSRGESGNVFPSDTCIAVHVLAQTAGARIDGSSFEMAKLREMKADCN